MIVCLEVIIGFYLRILKENGLLSTSFLFEWRSFVRLSNQRTDRKNCFVSRHLGHVEGVLIFRCVIRSDRLCDSYGARVQVTSEGGLLQVVIGPLAVDT